MDFEQGQLGDLDIKKKVPCNLLIYRLEKSPSTSPLPLPLRQIVHSLSFWNVLVKSRDAKASDWPPQEKRRFGEDLSFIQKYGVVETQLYDGSHPEGSGRVRVPLCSLLHKHNEAQPSGVRAFRQRVLEGICFQIRGAVPVFKSLPNGACWQCRRGTATGHTFLWALKRMRVSFLQKRPIHSNYFWSWR